MARAAARREAARPEAARQEAARQEAAGRRAAAALLSSWSGQKRRPAQGPARGQTSKSPKIASQSPPWAKQKERTLYHTKTAITSLAISIPSRARRRRPPPPASHPASTHRRRAPPYLSTTLNSAR